MSRVREQPVLFWGSITTIAEAGIGMILIFEVATWTPEQVGAIMVVVAAFGSLFTFLVRGKVTSLDRPRDNAGHPLIPALPASDDPPVLPPI